MAVVRLTRIYTRLGDGGDTHLGDMSRARKTSPRVVAYGDVDELNSALGVARAEGLAGAGSTAGSGWSRTTSSTSAPTSACRPATTSRRGPACGSPPRRWSGWRRWCDEVNETLEPLTSFVLPAGTRAAAALHLARAVCRRAERSAVALADAEPVTPEALAYLNRLSDLLFILARAANRDGGRGDVLWTPGESR